jgi:hypothetical protein
VKDRSVKPWIGVWSGKDWSLLRKIDLKPSIFVRYRYLIGGGEKNRAGAYVLGGRARAA